MTKNMFEIERNAEDHYDVLHVQLRFPRRPRVLPVSTHEHLRTVLRETLLAGTSILDALVERVEKAPAKTATNIQAE